MNSFSFLEKIFISYFIIKKSLKKLNETVKENILQGFCIRYDIIKVKIKKNLSIISPKHSIKDLCKIKRNLKEEILVCFIKEFNYTSVALKNRAHCILSIQCTIFRI